MLWRPRQREGHELVETEQQNPGSWDILRLWDTNTRRLNHERFNGRGHERHILKFPRSFTEDRWRYDGRRAPYWRADSRLAAAPSRARWGGALADGHHRRAVDLSKTTAGI